MRCGASAAVVNSVVFPYITALSGFTEDVLVFSLPLNVSKQTVAKWCVCHWEKTIHWKNTFRLKTLLAGE